MQTTKGTKHTKKPNGFSCVFVIFVPSWLRYGRRDWLAVHGLVGIGHLEGRFPRQQDIRNRLERDRKAYAGDALVVACDLNVSRPERGVLREQALHSHQIAILRPQEDRPIEEQ